MNPYPLPLTLSRQGEGVHERLPGLALNTDFSHGLCGRVISAVYMEMEMSFGVVPTWVASWRNVNSVVEASFFVLDFCCLETREEV